MRWGTSMWLFHTVSYGKPSHPRALYEILAGELEGKRPGRGLGNIKIYLKEISYEGVDWIHLAQYMVFWTQQWSLGFHKIGGISRLAGWQEASEEELWLP
jgi:hypothetical protein